MTQKQLESIVRRMAYVATELAEEGGECTDVSIYSDEKNPKEIVLVMQNTGVYNYWVYDENGRCIDFEQS